MSRTDEPTADIGDSTTHKAFAAIDRVILNNRPFSDVRRFFHTRLEAARYFADRVTTLYAPQAAGGPCTCCGSRSDARPVEMRWRIPSTRHYLIVVGGFLNHVPTVGEFVTFNTYHLFCGACWTTLRRRRRWAAAMTFVGIIAVFVGIYCLFRALESHVRSLDGWGSFDGTWFAVAPVVAWAGVALLRGARRLRVPAALSHVGSPPVESVGAVMF